MTSLPGLSENIKTFNHLGIKDNRIIWLPESSSNLKNQVNLENKDDLNRPCPDLVRELVGIRIARKYDGKVKFFPKYIRNKFI